jgi:hypothetical protein
MSSTRNTRATHPMAAIAVALLATIAFALPVAAGGNAAASAACEGPGYLEWSDAEGDAFRNAGACVSYAARGGTLVPVVVDVNPFAVVYRASGANGFEATVTGSGLEPESSVDVYMTWGDVPAPMPIGDLADASGNASFFVTGACTSGGLALTEFAVVGIPAGGEQTEYPFPVPDGSVCPVTP